MSNDVSEKEINPETGEEIKRNEYKKMGIYDFFRRDIERFTKHPENAIISPGLLPPKPPKAPPDFVRNVWGSAAGVGSGDFHVYRGIRRREYARLESLEKEAEEEKVNEEFQKKQKELNESMALKTAKKRAKRQKKKAKLVDKKKTKQKCDSKQESDHETDDSN